MKQSFRRGNFKTPLFIQSLCRAQILILEIFNIFLWLKFSPSLTLDKIEHFETASVEKDDDFARNPSSIEDQRKAIIIMAEGVELVKYPKRETLSSTGKRGKY